MMNCGRGDGGGGNAMIRAVKCGMGGRCAVRWVNGCDGEWAMAGGVSGGDIAWVSDDDGQWCWCADRRANWVAML